MPEQLLQRTCELLAEQQSTILAEWIEGQLTDRRVRAGLLTRAEVTLQSQEILELLVEATTNGDLDCPEAPQYDAVKTRLGDIITERLQRGLTRQESVLGVMCLKDFWVPVVRAEYRDDPEVQNHEIIRIFKLMDALTLSAFEIAWRFQEDQYRLMVDSVPDYAITMLDRMGRILTWNSSGEKLIGYQTEEILGKNFACFYPPEVVQAGWPICELRLAADNGRFADENWRVRKDGSRFWASVVIAPLYDPRGQAQGFAKVTRDLTEQSKSALALRAQVCELEERARLIRSSQERFRVVIESAPHGMVMIDSAGQIVLVNAETEKLFGYCRAEMLGQPVEMLLPARYRQRHLSQRNAFLAQPTARSMGNGRVLFGRRKDGSEFPIEIGLNPMRTEEGLFVLSAITDITERRYINEVQARLAAIVASSDDAIIGETLDGVITSWNAGATRIFQYSAEETIGRSIAMLLPPESSDDLSSMLAKIRRGETLVHYETVRRRKDGQDIEVSLTISPIRDAAGTVIWISKIAREITEQKRNERELQRLYENLEQRVAERTEQLDKSNKELEAFAYSVSHDLRSPLRAIDGFSQILLKEYQSSLGAKPQRYLQKVCDNTRLMGRLIDDLLRFSHANQQSLRVDCVDTAGLVRQCLKELQHDLANRRVEMLIGELPPCEADGALLKQVWLNLLSNALKFTRKREGARVEIGSREQDGETVYFVRDNGVGFDMRYVEKLFGVFQRLHAAEEFEGTGIGLALVQRILLRHGGHAWAEGKEEEGATIYFTLKRSAGRDSD